MFEAIVHFSPQNLKLVKWEPATKQIVNQSSIAQIFGRLSSVTRNIPFVTQVRTSALEALHSQIEDNEEHFKLAEDKLNRTIRLGRPINAKVVTSIYKKTKPQIMTEKQQTLLLARKDVLASLIVQANHHHQVSLETAASSRGKEKTFALKEAKAFAKLVDKTEKEIHEVQQKLDYNTLQKIVS